MPRPRDTDVHRQRDPDGERSKRQGTGHIRDFYDRLQDLSRLHSPNALSVGEAPNGFLVHGQQRRVQQAIQQASRIGKLRRRRTIRRWRLHVDRDGDPLRREARGHDQVLPRTSLLELRPKGFRDAAQGDFLFRDAAQRDFLPQACQAPHLLTDKLIGEATQAAQPRFVLFSRPAPPRFLCRVRADRERERERERLAAFIFGRLSVCLVRASKERQ
mmetsp:Transcript_42260/g.105520  ORF Transcript_42260/g.105520 Transcript_42260/m.105520 type:complete len:216 (-) Transcript_42260:166-813(-)